MLAIELATVLFTVSRLQEVFRKMKLLVQTAVPPMAPVKSQGKVCCLDANHLLSGREGKVGA